MAGTPLGTSVPILTHVAVVDHRTTTTRTQRTHCGIVLAGGELVTVGSARRARECQAVTLQVYGVTGAEHMVRDTLTPVQVRQLARAASAVDQAQRNPQFTRAEVRNG